MQTVSSETMQKMTTVFRFVRCLESKYLGTKQNKIHAIVPEGILNTIVKQFVKIFFSFSDIDECSNYTLNNCEQTCFNSFGSFSCECDFGYSLNSNGYGCDGE